MNRVLSCGLVTALLLQSACREALSTNQRTADSIVASLADSLTAITGARGWQAVDSVPHLRLEGATAKIGDRAFLIGGFGGPELDGLLDVDVLDHRTGHWSRAADLPAPVTHMQAAVVGDTAIWIAGGFHGRHPAPPTDAVWRYDVAADRWLAGPALPAPRGGGALLALGDTLYFVGGWSEDRATDRREVWRLLPRAARWDARALIPEGRGHVGAVSANGKLLLLGGQQSHDLAPVDLQSAWSYDPAADRWMPLADAPMTRSHAEPATVRWGDWVLVPGGGDIGSGRRYIADVLGYDARRDRWRRRPDLPLKLRGAHAWLGGDTLQITGGADANNAPSNWIRWKHALRGEWMLLPGEGPKVNDASMAVVGDDLVLFGSHQRPTWRYDLRAGRWSDEDAFPFRPRQGQILTLASEGSQLQLLGGESVTGSHGVVQSFDGMRRRWSPGRIAPPGLATPEIVIAQGVTWLVSGPRTPTDSGAVFRLDLQGRWDSVTSLPHPRHRPVIATDGTLVCLFGGAVPGKASWSNDVQCLDLVTRRWRTSASGVLAPMPEMDVLPRAAVFAAGRFWMGGLYRTYGLDVPRNVWVSGPDVPFPDGSGTLTADGDRLLRYSPATGQLWMLWP